MPNQEVIYAPSVPLAEKGDNYWTDHTVTRRTILGGAAATGVVLAVGIGGEVGRKDAQAASNKPLRLDRPGARLLAPKYSETIISHLHANSGHDIDEVKNMDLMRAEFDAMASEEGHKQPYLIFEEHSHQWAVEKGKNLGDLTDGQLASLLPHIEGSSKIKPTEEDGHIEGCNCLGDPEKWWENDYYLQDDVYEEDEDGTVRIFRATYLDNVFVGGFTEPILSGIAEQAGTIRVRLSNGDEAVYSVPAGEFVIDQVVPTFDNLMLGVEPFGTNIKQAKISFGANRLKAFHNTEDALPEKSLLGAEVRPRKSGLPTIPHLAFIGDNAVPATEAADHATLANEAIAKGLRVKYNHMFFGESGTTEADKIRDVFNSMMAADLYKATLIEVQPGNRGASEADQIMLYRMLVAAGKNVYMMEGSDAHSPYTARNYKIWSGSNQINYNPKVDGPVLTNGVLVKKLRSGRFSAAKREGNGKRFQTYTLDYAAVGRTMGFMGKGKADFDEPIVHNNIPNGYQAVVDQFRLDGNNNLEFLQEGVPVELAQIQKTKSVLQVSARNSDGEVVHYGQPIRINP